VELLGIGSVEDGAVAVSVHPAMIPGDRPLASVRGGFMAVFIEGAKVGSLMLSGRGAWGDPSATSVVGDLIEIVRNRRDGGRSPGVVARAGRRIKPIDEMSAQYYVLLQVEDRPGVLAAIAHAFGEHHVSIKYVWQEG